MPLPLKNATAASESWSHPPSLESWLTTCLVGATWLAVVLGLAVARGGWMDEFITYQVTDPSRTWRDLNAAYWGGEPHVPTYYALQWWWRRHVDVGSPLFAMRVLSLTGSAVLAFFSLWTARRLLGGPPLMALFLFSAPAALYFAQESRSYFLSFHGGVLLGLFALLCLLHPVWDLRARAAAALIAATGVILCSVHIVSTLIAGFVLSGLLLAMLLHGHRVAALTTVAVLALVAVPSLLISLGLTSVRAAVAGFWITRWDQLETALWLPAFLGPGVLCALAAALTRTGRRWLGAPEGRPARVLFAVAVALVAVMFTGALARPFFVTRYLSAFAGFLVLPSAWVAASLFQAEGRRPGPLFSGLTMAAGIACALIVPHASGDWRTPGRFIAGIPRCQGAAIPIAILTQTPPADEMDRWDLMFRWYAGSDKRFVPATTAAVAATEGSPCPVRLWAAQLQERYLSSEVKQAMALACHSPSGSVDVLPFDKGYLFIRREEPPLSRSWPGRPLACSTTGLAASGLAPER